MINKWYCPVCGYNVTHFAVSGGRLLEFSAILDTSYVLEPNICPCCGIQFGNDDWDEKARMQVYGKLRKQWIKNGMKWKHEDFYSIAEKPPHWNPLEQLKNIPKEFLGTDEHY